ncbi:MAG: hypothetical protein WCD70_10460 [Alphaproteobacteria bacterium]
MTSREIFIETRSIGSILRVTAIDADSGTEVVFQAPANASRAQLQSLAADKLRYVMNKEK